MSTEVVDLHICICIRTSHCLYLLIGCTLQLCCHSLLRHHQPSFPAVLTCFHLFATVWREVTWPPLCSNWGAISRHFLSQTLLNKDRQCCESWRDAELGVHAVCAVGDIHDWWRPLSRSAVLFATLWHCRELSDEWFTHHIQFEFWLLRRLTPAITDRPPPILWCQQSVPSVSSTKQLLQCVCCSASAAQRLLLATSFWWHSWFCTMLQTLFPHCT